MFVKGDVVQLVDEEILRSNGLSPAQWKKYGLQRFERPRTFIVATCKQQPSVSPGHVIWQLTFLPTMEAFGGFGFDKPIPNARWFELVNQCPN